jgi:hypothetical protein
MLSCSHGRGAMLHCLLRVTDAFNQMWSGRLLRVIGAGQHWPPARFSKESYLGHKPFGCQSSVLVIHGWVVS